MKELSISRGKETVWPTKCAKCCSTDGVTSVGASTGRVLHVSPTLGGLNFENELLTVRYPVCSKHKTLSAISNALMRNTAGYKMLRMMVYSAGIFSVPLLLLIPVTVVLSIIKGQPLDLGGATAIAALPGVLTLAFIYFYFYRAVRIAKVTDNELVLRFSNDEYAREFAVSNSAKST